MAFTGAATFQQVSEQVVRITGLSLAGAAAGTIGPHGSGANVELPESFQPKATKFNGVAVPLDAALDYTSKPAGSVVTSVPIEITKAGSGVATFTNTTVATASPALEIYVKYLT